MPDNELAFTRRRIVGLSCLLASISGCTESRSTDPSTESQTSGTQQSESTDTPTDSQTTDTQQSESVNSADDFYIENRDISTHEITVELTADADSDPLVADTFALPATTAITFEDIAEPGTYAITAETDDGRTVSAEWTVTDCGEVEGSGANRDGAVQVTTDEFRFRQNACDAIFVGTAGIPYDDPDDHRV